MSVSVWACAHTYQYLHRSEVMSPVWDWTSGYLWTIWYGCWASNNLVQFLVAEPFSQPQCMYFLSLSSFKLHVKSSPNVKGRVTCLALSLASVPYVLGGCFLPAHGLLFVSCFEERFPVPDHWLHSGGSSLGSGLGHQITSNCYPSHKGHLSLLPFSWDWSSCGKGCLAVLLSCWGSFEEAKLWHGAGSDLGKTLKPGDATLFDLVEESKLTKYNYNGMLNT